MLKGQTRCVRPCPEPVEGPCPEPVRPCPEPVRPCPEPVEGPFDKLRSFECLRMIGRRGAGRTDWGTGAGVGVRAKGTINNVAMARDREAVSGPVLSLGEGSFDKLRSFEFPQDDRTEGAGRTEGG